MENLEIKSKGVNMLEYIKLTEESSADRRIPQIVWKQKMLIYHSNACILNIQMQKRVKDSKL